MSNKNVDLETIWKEIKKHQQILKRVLFDLEEPRAEIDEMKAENRNTRQIRAEG